MSQHFLREIETLKKKILAVGAAVEERISQAITTVVKRDAALAQQVTEGDDEIDEMEVEVEEDCLKILALYQPVAIDLRFVVAVLKMNNDLERMADTAVNIARRAEYLASQPQVDLPPSLTRHDPESPGDGEAESRRHGTRRYRPGPQSVCG